MAQWLWGARPTMIAGSHGKRPVATDISHSWLKSTIRGQIGDQGPRVLGRSPVAGAPTLALNQCREEAMSVSNDADNRDGRKRMEREIQKKKGKKREKGGSFTKIPDEIVDRRWCFKVLGRTGN